MPLSERALFSHKKRLKTVPQGHQNSATLQKGHFFWKTVPLSLKGHSFSAPLALFLYRKCMGKQCPFGKWHQNSAPKGTILQTTEWCPKGTILVPLEYTVDLFIHLKISTGENDCCRVFFASKALN